MASLKREGRKDRRREEILEAAERVFAEKGYHEAGIADIAGPLGLGHGTVYRYFKNKHDIALHLFDRLMARFAAIGLAEDPAAANTLDEYRAQVLRIARGWLDLAEQHPMLVRFFHEQTGVVDMDRLASIVEGYVAITEQFLKNGVAKRFLRAQLDTRVTAEVLVAIIFEGTRRALGAGDAAARERWMAGAVALMFDGVRK